MNLTLRTALVSDPGLVRTNNEDAAHAGERLLVVADGVGGQPAGEVASAIVIRNLLPLDRAPIGTDPAAALTGALNLANQQIAEAARSDPEQAGLGTTVTAVLLTGNQLALLHVGDSRCYLARDPNFYQLTRDDTFVQELVDRGALTPAQAHRHPQRSIITQAVQGGDIVPSTAVVAVAAGDRLMLCSDGLSDVVDDDAIGEALAQHAEPQQCAEQLVKLAHQGGAPDNVTVIIADLVAG
ncbi:PP2C family protein-serine/threonine phosphatase [Micromonospora sp. NPDC050397]|uniref:PP2C family protein-serine/threonine phosphatase n=1 Tax=Micromonospora sp. NPDC050397 TaxID=3364279 RepID=UPI00384BB9D2